MAVVQFDAPAINKSGDKTGQILVGLLIGAVVIYLGYQYVYVPYINKKKQENAAAK